MNAGGWPARRMTGLAEWSAPVLPAAAFLLMPKCPACFAAHAALWTGAGLSMSAVVHVRTGLLIVTAALLALVVVRWVRRSRRGPIEGERP